MYIKEHIKNYRKKYIFTILFLITSMVFAKGTYVAMETEKSQNNFEQYSTAIFAMGCFWCAEVEYDNLDGVVDVVVGYAGGTEPNPTYENHQGYKEAIKIYYDSEKISYKKLLEVFWRNVDPFDAKGQFCDKGFAYTSAIYYQSDEELKLAEQSKQELTQEFQSAKKSYTTIATEIIKYTTFYDAEDYHQDYSKKNSTRYKFYRWNCGRDARLKQIWGK